MQNGMFGKFGKLIYKMRWLIVCAWLVLVMVCLPVAPHAIGVFKTTGFRVDDSESVRTENLINEKIGMGSNKFIVIYSSQELKTSDPAFMRKVNQSLSGLKNYHIAHEIITPGANKRQISEDKHTAYAVILLKQVDTISDKDLQQLKSLIKTPAKMNVVIGGEQVFVESVNHQTQEDLFKADIIAAPITILIMIVIFESIVGAIVPIVIGAGCSLMTLTLLYLIGSHVVLSIFTLNIALLLGLCLSLDYALFIISRFRYELRNGRDTREALMVTQATAGKAVLFSGLAVLVSLSPLLFFPINILFSIGVGGIVAVFVAVTTANIVLPALLGIMNKRINYLAIKMLTPIENGQSPFWRWIVTKVVKRPLAYFVVILGVLLILSYPMLHIRLGISDFRILPPHAKSRLFFDEFNSKFNENALTPMQMVVETEGDILSERNLSKLASMTRALSKNSSVSEIDSIVTTDPLLTAQQYHALYTMPLHQMNRDIRTLLDTTTTKHLSVITITPKFAANSHQSKQLADELLKQKLPSGMSASVTGTTLRNIEVFAAIKQIFPYAVLAIMFFTYVILLVLLRSLLLPLKAILTTTLSLCASYGVLVFIIQSGHFSGLLNFEPQQMLDISLIIIIFCALFGFSMDYEVFLLTRIKECYDATGKTNESIIFGVEHSSRIITSAAIIVIAICCSFMFADVLMVKAFGLGIAVAIFTDAFLIRSLLVPATMTMMKSWNWYLPKWLGRWIP